jgi:hypothetical protein
MTRDELIEKVAQVLHEARHPDWKCPGPEAKDRKAALALADASLLADIERDELQARLDRVTAVLARPWPDDEDHHDFVSQQVEDARAALQGDQPTEPGAAT